MYTWISGPLFSFWGWTEIRDKQASLRTIPFLHELRTVLTVRIELHRIAWHVRSESGEPVHHEKFREQDFESSDRQRARRLHKVKRNTLHRFSHSAKPVGLKETQNCCSLRNLLIRSGHNTVGQDGSRSSRWTWSVAILSQQMLRKSN